MNRLFLLLLTLLFSLNGLALGKLSDLGCWSNAANNGLRQPRAGGLACSTDDVYAAIRASTYEVASIAGHTGIKPANIKKIKNHIFYKEHLLDGGLSAG